MRRIFRPGNENAVFVVLVIVPVGRIAAYLAHAAVAVVQYAERNIVHVRLLRPYARFPPCAIRAFYTALRAVPLSVAVGGELLVAPAAFNRSQRFVVSAFVRTISRVVVPVHKLLAAHAALVLVFGRFMTLVRSPALFRAVPVDAGHLLVLFAAALALRDWMVVCLAARIAFHACRVVGLELSTAAYALDLVHGCDAFTGRYAMLP